MYRRIAKAQNLTTTGLTLFQLDERVGLSDYHHSTTHYIEKEVRLPWGVTKKTPIISIRILGCPILRLRRLPL
ncbi:MAG: hypothetical protein WBM43_01395 [Flavobacteriaceae bacterium]